MLREKTGVTLSGRKSGLTKALYCSLAILFATTLPSFSAQAGIWDDLPKEEQELVQKKTLEELGKMLNQGEPSAELTLIGNNIGAWSTHLAQIANGEHHKASDALISHATETFVKTFEQELEKKVSSLESPSLNFIYTNVISHKDETRKIAILALNSKFSEAGKIAWDTAEKDVIAAIKEKTDTTLNFAFNWVFNDAKIAGMSPAQIFREVIRVEKILITEMDSYLRNSQQNQILEIYNEMLRTNGGNHAAAWNMLGQSHINIKARSVAFLEEGVLKKALVQCAERGYGSLGGCIKDVQTRSRQKLQQQKATTENILKEIEAQQKAKTAAAYKQVQALVLRIIAEHSQEYKDAVSEANSILKKLQTQAKGMQADCTAYDDKKALVDGIAAKVKAANIAAAKLRGYSALAVECKTLSDAPDDMDIILQGMNTAKGSFDTDIRSVANKTDLVCQKTGTIASAFSRAEGKKILDEALKQQQELGLAINKSQASAQLIRNENSDVGTSVKALTDQIAELEKSLENIGDIDAELEKLEAVKGARIDYEAALSELKAIVNRLTSRKENMAKANPVELNVFEQIDSAIQGGIDTKGKTRISKLLARYRNFPKVQAVVQEMKAAYGEAECANYAIRSSGAANNFEALKWEPLKSPLGDLITKVNETRTDCQGIPDASALDKYVSDASAIALDMEAQELPWIYQKQAEQCIAAGLQAYNSLADPSSALRGEVQQLEGVCSAASAKANSALGSATSARQLSESLLSARTLEAQAQSKSADINACADLDNIRGRVAQSASEARGALGNAQAAAAHGTGIARACASKATLGAIDGDLNSIASNLRGAVVALGKVQEGDNQFDRIVGTGRQAQAYLQEVWNKLSQLVLVRSGVGDHIKSARRSKDAAVAGFANCKATQSALVAKAESLRGSVADETLAGLLLRIRAVVTEPGDMLTQIDQLIALADIRAGDLDAANSSVDGLIASAKSQCTGKESPYSDVLSTMQAVLTIEELSQALNLERGKCTAKLAANTTSGGRGDYPGLDKDSGNIDPARVASSGGGSPPVGGGSNRGNDPEQQNAPRGGAPLDPNYRGDPIADAERDRERAENAERVASAANPRRRDPRSRRNDDNDISDYGEAPDLDGIGGGGGGQDNDRDRPGDNDNGPNNDRNNNDPEGPSEPNPAGPTNPDPSEDNNTEPDAPKPETPEPEPPKPEQPVTPPSPPPAPPQDNARCSQIVQGLQTQSNNIMTSFSSFQAAAAAKDEVAAQRIGCQILGQMDQILNSFNQLSSEGCPIKGNTAELRSTIERMQSQIKSQLRDECGVSTAPTAGSFAGTWNAKGTCPASGNAAFRWVVSLTQSGDKVSGSIHFHQCPGGGRASYNVSGTAGSGASVTLRGTLTGGRGPLGSSASKSKTFTVSKNGAPSPNYAP